MRFLLPLLGLVVVAAARAEVQTAPGPIVVAARVGAEPASRPIVVLVHGRGHLEDDTAAIRRMWHRDLDSALAAVGMPPLDSGDVRLAWYADVLDPSNDAGCAVTRSVGNSGTFEMFAADFLGSLASALRGPESREARMLLGDMLYAVAPARRCAAQRRVGDVIAAAAAENRPVVVVAYSLGSLVSYSYLISPEFAASAKRQIRFVTLGSPLGNPEIRTLLGLGVERPRLPAGVSAWENVYDPRDAFAAPLESAASGVRDRVTAAPHTHGDPHFVGRYLRDRATGAAIGRAICAFAKDAQPPGCPIAD